MLSSPPTTEVSTKINSTQINFKQLILNCFTEPLVDLGEENPKYKGIQCPKSEVSLPKIGVTETLLSGAEEYFQKHKHYSYIYHLLKTEFDLLQYSPQGLAIDFGSGFGNSVIPLLEHHTNLKIIATDISPDLLAILDREANKKGFQDRCAVVAMDAQRDYFKSEIADAVFGCAVLHHMAEPEKVFRTALKVLKPGGYAIFFEPFELGNAVLRLAYLEILETAKRLGESGPAFDFLAGINMDIYVRSHRQRLPGWEEKWYSLDDKYLFTVDSLKAICSEMGCSNLQIRSLHDSQSPFTKHTSMILTSYAALSPDHLPKWAWDILYRYDNEHFSPELKKELIIEGAIVFRK